MENVVIAGSGPAGLTAAIYTAQSELNPLVLEGPVPGEQLIVSNEVENYPGFAAPVLGMELMERFHKQAEHFGACFKSQPVEEILGDNTVTGAALKNPVTGEKREIPCDGIFVAIGHDPKTQVFKALVETDEQDCIKVKAGSTRTLTPGVFACGDVCDPVYKQAVVAAGQGCMAAVDVGRYLAGNEI